MKSLVLIIMILTGQLIFAQEQEIRVEYRTRLAIPGTQQFEEHITESAPNACLQRVRDKISEAFAGSDLAKIFDPSDLRVGIRYGRSHHPFHHGHVTLDEGEDLSGIEVDGLRISLGLRARAGQYGPSGHASIDVGDFDYSTREMRPLDPGRESYQFQINRVGQDHSFSYGNRMTATVPSDAPAGYSICDQDYSVVFNFWEEEVLTPAERVIIDAGLEIPTVGAEQVLAHAQAPRAISEVLSTEDGDRRADTQNQDDQQEFQPVEQR